MKKVLRKDISEIKKMIQKSTLDNILKKGIIETLDNPDDFYPDGDEEFVRCDLETSLEWLEAKGLYNSEVGYRSEHSEGGKKLAEHFKENLKNFPYIIATEDFVVLYAPKGENNNGR